MTDHTYIYALIDPRDGRPFYVGKTNHPSARMRYGYKFNPEVNTRLDEIEIAGLGISPTVLETVHANSGILTKQDWVPREQYWIVLYKSAGFVLFNKNDGGGGPTYHTPEALAKSVAPLWGRPATDKIRETTRKLGLSRRGSKQTNYQKVTVSKALKGRPKPPFSVEHRINLCLAHKSRWTAEARAARQASQNKLWSDPQYRERMRAAHRGQRHA
jgi:hypothetical protein